MMSWFTEGGHKFNLKDVKTLKRDAQKRARQLRVDGWLVRVKPYGSKAWGVYIAHRK